MMPTPSVPEMLDAQYALMVHNHTPLYGPWKGWRLAGRDLVSPDKVRLSPERLKGLVHRRDFRLFQVETLRFEADNFAIR